MQGPVRDRGTAVRSRAVRAAESACLMDITDSMATIQVYTDVCARMQEAEVEDAPTFSRALEIISPSESGDELDAFGRYLTGRKRAWLAAIDDHDRFTAEERGHRDIGGVREEGREQKNESR